MRDLSDFVQESFDEILYKKKKQMRNGFDVKGERPLCLVPHRQFSQWMAQTVTPQGQTYYNELKKPSIEYFGFILVSSDVDEITFCIEI